MFGAGKTVYHAQTMIMETGEPVRDGFQAVYINTAVDDGSKIARLMKHFKEPDFDDAEFPNSSRRMKELKHNPKEVERMCKSVEAYAEKKANEASIRTTIKDGLFYGAAEDQIIFRLMEKYNLDKETAISYYEEFSSQPV
jgi:hypothetical protein